MSLKLIVGNVAELLANMSSDNPPKKVVAGNPALFSNEIAEKPELYAGVWSSTVGSWEIEAWPVHEVMVIQSGRVRLTDRAGKPTEFGAGEMVVVPKGWSGLWETLEDVEKVYVIVP